MTHQQTYHVAGMHCASCEVLIEKTLRELPTVTSANASLRKSAVTIEYNNSKPTIEQLNELFAQHGYTFSEETAIRKEEGRAGTFVTPFVIALGIIIAFLIFNKVGVRVAVSGLSINSKSSLPTFFLFGLVAGISTCAALIGGLVLSLSKQWAAQYVDTRPFLSKFQPHLLFNIGRLVSFGIFGSLLGLLGSKIQLSQQLTSVLIVLVSIIMVILSLQMLGLKYFHRFKFALPKAMIGKIVDDSHLARKWGPFTIGFLTFFVPCGFTVIAQSTAVLCAQALQGGLLMLSFALGTSLPLLGIGLSSTKLLQNKRVATMFVKVAGLLILFFAAYNLNVQFSFAQYLSGRSNSTVIMGDYEREQQEGTIQIIKTAYTNVYDIQPNSFQVKRGVPVRFEVEVRETAFGCMSTIMIPGLYNRPEYLRSGRKIIMEFTPTRVGSYQITCAMGVPRGVLTVTQ